MEWILGTALRFLNRVHAVRPVGVLLSFVSEKT